MEVTSVDDYKDQVEGATAEHVAAFFVAKWHPPAVQLLNMLPLLKKDFPKMLMAKVDADDSPALMSECKVSVLPTVILYSSNSEVSRLSGFDPPALVERLKSLVAGKLDSTSAAPATSHGDGGDKGQKLQQRLKALTTAANVMIFIKGSRAEPFCRFSKQVMGIMSKFPDVEFATFDIFRDEEVRQGLKDFSKWPTYPQLYVKGEFIGGVDIMLQMDEDGSLAELFEEFSSKKKEALTARLEQLVKQAPVMLFMKGSPSAPQCKFSKQIIGILSQTDIEFGYFDILTDDEVRQGLKEMSKWPTYPQVYANGQLIGGVDIIQEIWSSGGADSLKEELQASSA